MTSSAASRAAGRCGFCCRPRPWHRRRWRRARPRGRGRGGNKQPAAAAPQALAADRAYIAFFELGSAAVGPRGRRIVAEAVRSAVAQGGGGAGRVELRACADRSGRPDSNLRLSRRRAGAVADEPARRGVPRGRAAIQAHGESRPFVPTRDGEREGQNRGVWIVVRRAGGGGGGLSRPSPPRRTPGPTPGP